jgi:hypothetical protein
MQAQHHLIFSPPPPPPRRATNYLVGKFPLLTIIKRQYFPAGVKNDSSLAKKETILDVGSLPLFKMADKASGFSQNNIGLCVLCAPPRISTYFLSEQSYSCR